MKNTIEFDVEPRRADPRFATGVVREWNRVVGECGGSSRGVELNPGIGRHARDDFWSPAISVPTWKRLLDVTAVLLSLPVWGPLFLLIAGLIKLCSKGPILFRQERVGLQGRRFVCLKFRSMKVGADTGVHKDYLKGLINSNTPMTKMDARGDARLIPFGSILRSSGLDELPQLINVLRGEMSLVGPRPSIPYEYEDFLPWQKARCDTLPGLTGLWQVSGKNRTTFNEMINLDIAYVNRKSLRLDLRIMFGTVPAIVAQILETRDARRTQDFSVVRTRHI